MHRADGRPAALAGSLRALRSGRRSCTTQTPYRWDVCAAAFQPFGRATRNPTVAGTTTAAPRTTDTIQFWLSAENLHYRWRALFAARGGFTITVWGQPIGDHHSLGDLSYFRDLFFFVFGTYEFPYEAEIIITVNDIPGDGWPLPLPEQSQGDRIRDVTRNGQLGFGYGPARPFT